jgi:hypothetical protein
MIAFSSWNSPLKMRSDIVGVLSRISNGGLAPFAVLRAHEALRDDRAKIGGQVHQQLVAALFREEVDDPVKRLVGVVRVQRAQAKVPRFGERDRMLHRLRIPDLADQDHVRRLPQRIFQRVVPGMRIDAHFAMRDETLERRVNVFDRVLDRDDVSGGRPVAVIDHRRERRRLARAGGADDEHESALVHHDVLQGFGQAKLLEVRHLGRDRAHDHADMLLLDEDVDAKARQAWYRQREVAFELAGKFLALTLVHHRVRKLTRDGTGELLAGQRADVAVRFMLGGKSFAMNRSEPPASVIAANSLCM